METQAVDKRSKRRRECRDPEVGRQLTAYEFGWLSHAETRRFEAHLQECRACRHDRDRMASVWSTGQDHSEGIQPKPEPAEQKANRPPVVRPVWLARCWRQVSLVVSMLLMVTMIYVFQPATRDGELLSHETVHLRQPAGNSPLNQGLEALHAGNTPAAQTFFQKALLQNPDSYEANYLLGLIGLREAERNHPMDHTKLNATVARLQKAVTVSEGWDNPVYAAQSYYYLARAYAAQRDSARALDVLSWIERLPTGDPDLGMIKRRAADLKALCRP